MKLEVKQFDKNSGERLSKPRIQKFGLRAFETSVRHNLTKQGFTLEILHDPNEWLRENAATVAQSKATLEAERQAKIEEAKAAEKAALKAEILAELKEEGLLAAPVKQTNSRTKKKEDSPEPSKEDQSEGAQADFGGEQ